MNTEQLAKFYEKFGRYPRDDDEVKAFLLELETGSMSLTQGNLNNLGPQDKIMLEFWEKHQRFPHTSEEFARFGGNPKQYEKSIRDVGNHLRSIGVDPLGTPEEAELNPYIKYMEQMRTRQEGQELGLLQEQSRAMMQGADINAQQAMMQQQQFKDQIIEQIKSDRIAKMRSGLTPMQIAQEEMQFMVGNMQMNNQQVQMANQQRLMATQQQQMNPYQAYINASQNVTGGQGWANLATGMAATDAGDLNMQVKQAMARGMTYSEALSQITRQDVTKPR